MIIEKQTVKSKSELQAVIQKERIGSSILYKGLQKKDLIEVLSSIKSPKQILVIIIES
jgi:hypothetical protein